MEQSSLYSSKRHEETDFNLKEWALKAKVSRENTNSRRFSASNLKSFREEAKSFRSSITISSTVSSPGYTVKEEIDPSTYSFTTALKALQAKTVYTWEYVRREGYTLNSKWSDAEKYICNPLSGEVPLECLSAKTLSERSFRSLTSRITMSAPLIYPSPHHFQAKTPITEHEDRLKIREKSKTRDVGIQSSLAVDLSSGSPSPAKNPSIKEGSIEKSGIEAEDDSSPPFSSEKPPSEETAAEVVQAKGTIDDEHHEKQFTETNADKKLRKLRKMMMICLCNNRVETQQKEEESHPSSCLSLKGLVQMTKRNKYKASAACNI